MEPLAAKIPRLEPSGREITALNSPGNHKYSSVATRRNVAASWLLAMAVPHQPPPLARLLCAHSTLCVQKPCRSTAEGQQHRHHQEQEQQQQGTTTTTKNQKQATNTIPISFRSQVSRASKHPMRDTRTPSLSASISGGCVAVHRRGLSRRQTYS